MGRDVQNLVLKTKKEKSIGGDVRGCHIPAKLVALSKNSFTAVATSLDLRIF